MDPNSVNDEAIQELAAILGSEFRRDTEKRALLMAALDLDDEFACMACANERAA